MGDRAPRQCSLVSRGTGINTITSGCAIDPYMSTREGYFDRINPASVPVYQIIRQNPCNHLGKAQVNIDSHVVAIADDGNDDDDADADADADDDDAIIVNTMWYARSYSIIHACHKESIPKGVK